MEPSNANVLAQTPIDRDFYERNGKFGFGFGFGTNI